MEQIENQNYNENKMRNTPVRKLLFKMALPAIISMLVQALYNIVDSVFVGLINIESEAEITALNYVFPLQMIVMAVAIGIGIGANSVVARRLGSNNKEGATQATMTGYLIIGLFYIIILACSFFLPRIFLNLYDTTAEIKEQAIAYAGITMAFSFGMYFEIYSNKILQGTGKMSVPMIAQIIGAVTNIILDPIFIFHPHQGIGLPFGLGLGVAGAAYATVIGQIVAALFVLIVIIRQKHEVDFTFKGFKLKMTTVKNILHVGLSVTVMNSINALTTMVLYAILSDSGVTVLGVYFKLQSFVFMPVFGLTQGLLPILGYNYGAKQKERFDQAVKYSIITSLVIMLIGIILFQSIPDIILKLFNLKDSYKLGIAALRIISISFIPAAFSIIMSTMFQSIGHGIKSLAMTLLRQTILLIPLAYLLKTLTNNDFLVWWSYPISEFICCLCFIPIVFITIKKAFHKFSPA